MHKHLIIERKIILSLHKILEQCDVTISAAEFKSLCQCIKDLDTITSEDFYECCTRYSVDARNPVLPLIAVGLLYSHNNPHIIPILKEIINNHLFHKEKRTPFLELKFWLFFDLKNRNLLSESEFEILYMAIKMGYPWPSIVGSALNEFAYKDSATIHSKEIENIITAQINLGKGDLNKTTMITQTKGGLSLDLGYGCPMGCAYCYRVSDCTEHYVNQWQPDFFITPDECIRRLLCHPWFTPHITPIGIMMSTTEAFLPHVWPTTYALLSELDSLQLTNRVTLITKCNVEESVLEKLNALRYIDIDLCVCYSNLPRSVEPASTPEKLKTFRYREKYQNITMIGYYRPIIEGYNTSEEKIREAFEQFKESGVKTIVYGGLKFGEDHIDNFKARNLALPTEYKIGSKYINEKTVERIHRIFIEVFGKTTDVKLLRRSSCARIIARGKKIPDYNCHFFYREALKGCDPYCAIHTMCTRFVMPTDVEVRSLLQRINKPDTKYEIRNTGLHLATKLSMYERTFLVQNLLAPVFFDE